MPETFPLSPWFPVRFKENQIKTLISNYGNGVEQRRNKVSGAGRIISFPLKYLSSSDLSTLYNFYVARLGATQSFNFTYKSTTYTVRFKQDGLSWEWFSESWINAGTIELQEVAA